MELPPSDAGADHPTSDEPFQFEVAYSMVGAPGAARGVAGSIETAESPSPSVLIATTENVYATPFVSPETVHEDLVAAAVQVFPSGLEVTL
jgi:hypothetical protein